MNQETRKCQNCHNEFTIEPDDFVFYEKIKVPPPTFCPECRSQRRMAFRNERNLYKKKCGAPNHSEDVISIFSPDNRQKVHDYKFWWSDGWDPLVYGKHYDFSKPFFDQLKYLWQETPDVALININPVNSDYCSHSEGNKNCYLVIGGDFNENVLYSGFPFYCKDSSDLYWVEKSELNYETIDCVKCLRLVFSSRCEECYDSAFLFDCKNCNNCFGCVSLRNKSYCIFNQSYSKGEYLEKIKQYDLGQWSNLEAVKNEVGKNLLKFPKRFTRTIRTINSTGDNLNESKNCKHCFDIFSGAEDSKYLWLTSAGVKDSYDCDHFGLKSELGYETSTLYPGNNTFFSKNIFNSHHIQYSYHCYNSSYLFGCMQLRDKQYCILNKQYTKEEYESLIPRIIQHMNDMPYVDQKSRVYRYGEFFPPELSPFAYNETIAQEYFPLTKEQAIEQGYRWKDPDTKEYTITKTPESLPDHIKDTDDSILKETIGCQHEGKCTHQCTTAFRIIPEELAFYKRMNLPLPRLCPNCRHYERLAQRNPLRLWHRQCQCNGTKSENGVYQNTVQHQHGVGHCPNEFETSYSPERKEIVYCEQCYNAEVV